MQHPGQKIIHRYFSVSLFLKAFDGLIETIGSLILYFTSIKTIDYLIFKLTSPELSEDPGDRISLWLVHLANNISLGAKNFVVIYFFLHGLVKILLAVFLLKKKAWAYPVAIIFIAIFVVYQLYRLSHHFASWLFVLTLFDIVVITLISLEYKYNLDKFKKPSLS